MKNLFLIALVLISTIGLAQSDSTKTNFYFAGGVSMSNVNKSNPNADTFTKAAFPSLEFGFTRKSVSLGIVGGLESFITIPKARGFYELKTTLSRPLGECSGYVLFGVGSYFEANSYAFIEYGGGFSYMSKDIGYSIQYSNWAGTNYVSIGFTTLIH